MIKSKELKRPGGASRGLYRKVSRAAGLFLAIIGIAIALPSAAHVHSETVYVGIDHEGHTAFMYDDSFDRLPDNPRDPDTSIIKIQKSPRWLLGFNFDVVRRHEDGGVEVVSHLPTYYEMVHHFVLTYVSSQRANVDRCTNRPMGTGSELTDFWWPTGYGYKMQGGELVVWEAHWENPAATSHSQGVETPHAEQVYLRIVLIFDDHEGGYRDTHVTWVGKNDPDNPCIEEFAVPPGEFEIQGGPFRAKEDMRIVATFMHTHDHARYIELRQNGNKLRRFTPAYARAGAMHADVGQGDTPLHVHNGHLPPQGLYHAWLPGAFGLIVKNGDELSAFGKFDNPHGRSIDNMVIFPIVWEKVPRPTK